MIRKQQMKIGEKIRFYRERCGLSQTQLESLLGIGIGVISKIEKGSRNPTKETIVKIGSGLRLKPEEVAHLLGINVYKIDIKEGVNENQY